MASRTREIDRGGRGLLVVLANVLVVACGALLLASHCVALPAAT